MIRVLTHAVRKSTQNLIKNETSPSASTTLRGRALTRVFSTRSRRRRKNAARLETKIQNEKDTSKRMTSQMNEMIDQTSSLNQHTNVSVNTFTAKDKDGNELSMDEYLQFASLSPWVPCPDPVALRALDISKAGPNDVHYELGSGDGRLNFHAIDSSYGVKKSVGIDIDPSLIHQSNTRKMKIHPAPENLEFICADLMDVEENHGAEAIQLWEQIQSECTVMTMYFVEDALTKIKPLLEKYLIGSNCKVVTIGYEMRGWEPAWAESILGLTIHMYDMRNLDMLYNSSSQFDHMDLGAPSAQDEELNILSKQKIAKMEKENVGENNPFIDKPPAPTRMKDDTEENVDFHWDFDESVEYNDDNNVVPPKSNSD